MGGSFSDPALILPGAVTNTEVSSIAGIEISKLSIDLRIKESYHNHLGVIDNFMQTALIGNGNVTADTTNHMITLSTVGPTNPSGAIFDSNKTWVLNTRPLIVNFLIQGIVHNAGAIVQTVLGLSNWISFSINHCAFRQNTNGTWDCRSQNTITAITAPVAGDLLTIVATSSTVLYFVNGILVVTHTTPPTEALHAGANVFSTGEVQGISIDMMSIEKYV